MNCLPVYKKYYPEIIEEIQGLADGQHCDVRILQAVLFGMYAMPPVCNCSCFAFAAGQEILLGRNSDFLTDLEKKNMNVIYRLAGGAYSFTGNTTAFVEMEDGINEQGLAVGLTSVYPCQCKPICWRNVRMYQKRSPVCIICPLPLLRHLLWQTQQEKSFS